MKTHARWCMLVAFGAIMVSGCDDAVTMDRAPGPDASVSAAEAGAEATARPRLTSNRVQYRSAGLKPAVGRAGSATLTAQVLVGLTGQAELHLVAGSTLAGPVGGAARLGTVQIKIFDEEGELVSTRNHLAPPATAEATYPLGAGARAGHVQVQATIIGADRARTGVVTVDVPLGLRPDLQVGDIAAPARAALYSAVAISATIRELNGQVGARAHCVLLVDGEEVDRAWWIWVDAGSSVTCAFRHRFDQLGLADVEVRLVDVEPGDFDPENNAARTTVDVMLIPSAFAYSASFRDVTFDNLSRSEYWWQSADGRYGGEGEYVNESTGREQSAMLWAWSPRRVTFPLDELMLRQLTRDEVVHDVRFLNVEPDWSWSDEWGSESCFWRWFDAPNGPTSFQLCSGEWEGSYEYSYVSYTRYAGEVTYHSRGSSRSWDLDAGYDDVWSWNYSDTYSEGRMVSYGREYSFFVYLEDVNGIYRMQPLVWLQPISEAYQSPWECWEYDDEWGAGRSCWESRWEATGLGEYVDGWPTY
jgi:hypothetical protein